MIGYIIFGLGLGIFIVALAFWIVYLIKCNKAQDFTKKVQMNSNMCFAGIFIAVGALVVNIGNLLIKYLP